MTTKPKKSQLTAGNLPATIANQNVYRAFWPLRLAARIFCAAAQGAAEAHREVLTPRGYQPHV